MCGRLAKGLLVSAMVCIGLPATMRADDRFSVDEDGQRLRVRFDPGSRVALGVLSGAGKLPAGWGHDLCLDLDLAWRSVFAFDQEGIQWQLDHVFARGRISPWIRSASQVPDLDLTAYRLTFLRHAKEPYLTWPGNPPRRFFFPFDVGLDIQAGRIRTQPPAGSEMEAVRLQVARAGLLLDPWRTGRSGQSVEIGLGARYDIDFIAAPDLARSNTAHRLAPMTDLSVRFRWQDEEGLTLVNLRAEVWPHWVSTGGWDYGAEGHARFERILVALNDQPIRAIIDAGITRHPRAPTLPDQVEARIQAGLAIDFQLR